MSDSNAKDLSAKDLRELSAVLEELLDALPGYIDGRFDKIERRAEKMLEKLKAAEMAKKAK